MMRVNSKPISIAIVAGTAAVILTATPGLAGAMPTMPTAHHHTHHTHHHVNKHRHAGKHHHHARHHALKKIAIDGIVKSVHHRHVTVLASTSRIGKHTTHNTTVHFTLGAHAKRSHQLRPGYVLHLSASGRGSTKHLMIPKLHSAHLAPAPASVIVGTVSQVEDGGLLVSQYSRDDGQHGRGMESHKLSVDTSAAKVMVDGSYGAKVARGDFVAILGEADGPNVLASRVYAFSSAAETIRGPISSVDGGKVAVRNYGQHTVVSLRSGDSQVPLFLNGSAASTSALRASDRIVVLGVVNEEEEAFQPLIAFAFNRHDHGPCGQNARVKPNGSSWY